MKDPHWYAVQVSDTTMIHIAASLFGQKIFLFTYVHFLQPGLKSKIVLVKIQTAFLQW